MLISPRLSVRRNPSKLTASMFSNNNLSEVFQSIQNGRPAPPSDYRYADVLAALRAAGVEGADTLSPDVDEVEPGSLLHRWIALLAIEEAEGYTQGPKGAAAIAAARAWVAEPNDKRQIASGRAGDATFTQQGATWTCVDGPAHEDASRVAMKAAHAVAYPTQAATYSAGAYTHSFLGAGGAVDPTGRPAYGRAAANANRSARNRFRVLATLAEEGLLPDPPASMLPNPRR